MATYDELYEKMYKQLKSEGINAEDCELEFGYQTTMNFVLRDPKSGAETEFEIDLRDYFNSPHDIPSLDENIDYYADMDELLEERADALASEYAEENADAVDEEEE